jgi:tRNA (guanine-N7-)-methyltransferase
MRLRNVTGSREVIAENEYVVHDEKENRGKWKEFFGNDNPLYIEIGMGKGTFIMECARQNPNINYIGIEKYSSVLIRAIEKRQQEPELTNLYFIRMDAEEIEEVFAPGEVDYIYLNFSDPWPKARTAKRRLTSDRFLGRYINILAEGAGITFKTDNIDLFEYSVETAEECGWRIEKITRDLHKSEYNEGNIMTEYEKKFSQLGNKINMMQYFPPKEKAEE